MATIKMDLTAKFQSSKDAETEETHFKTGDEVTIVQAWERFYLVKDDNGHYYNLSHDKVEK